ncbi:MAG: hypothetical protein ABL908_03575 [Hyphomicrobium sp.]
MTSALMTFAFMASHALAALAWLAAVPLDSAASSGFWALLNDPRKLGEATLIACGAIFVGFMVRRMWPRSMNPLLFGWLAATAVVAGLAYAGIASAGLVLWLFIAAAVLLGILAVVLG